jgi:hypothetical protein
MEDNSDYLTADKFEYLGVATSRYCNVITMDEKHVLVPCNSELRVYSFDTRAPLPDEDAKEDEKQPETVFDGRLEFYQSVTTASIMVLRESHAHYMGITNDGEVLLWNKVAAEDLLASKNFELVTRLKTDLHYDRHGDISEDSSTIAFVSEDLENNNLVIVKFDGEVLTLVQEINRIPNTLIRECEFDNIGNIILWSEINVSVENNGRVNKKTVCHSLSKLSVNLNNGQYEIVETLQIDDDSYLHHFRHFNDRKNAC